MPFGLKKDKGEKGGDLDSQKSSLFSRSKAAKSPAPSSANPYAAPPPASGSNPYATASSNPYAKPSNNPYATQAGNNDPYAPRSQSSLTQPPTSSLGSLTLNSDYGQPPAYRGTSPAPNRNDKSPVPPGGYGGSQPRYTSAGNYGQPSGYGSSNPYGASDQGPPAQSRYGPGGYGGLGGRRGSQETDIGKQELFGNAAQRAQQQKQQEEAVAAGQEAPQDQSYGNAGGYGGSGPDGYGEARELTAEEQEDEEVKGTKGLIHQTKGESVVGTRNALRIAQMAEQTGRDTLARLGQQGDRIHRAENNLDLASFQNIRAEEKAKELKTLNRSMFAVHVGNPFTSTKRYEEGLNRDLEKRQHERQTLEQTRAAAYSSQQRKQGHEKDLRGNMVPPAAKQRNLADRAKYQFEADSEDDEMENEIEDNLDQIHKAAKTLNQLGRAMGEEIDSQNKHIDRISSKTDKVDDQIAMNRARLDRIK